ncbi:hypothetical protein, partial [Halalkalibacter lacteus]|uniref:hypothetical protein n=1 Tax=Halalkalibacter lacteus TaxID=3090663 RepID=UPI003D6796CB
MEKSKEKMQQSVNLLCQHLKRLGFLINREKSVFEPKKSIEYLGFNFNTRTMIISLPPPKISKLLQRL